MSKRRKKRERGRTPEFSGYKPRKLVARSANQTAYIQAIQNSDIILCHGPAGTGKALGVGCKILTPSGFVYMRDIQRGETVCTPTGTAKVVGVYPQGIRPMHTFVFSDRTSITSSKDHLWSLIKLDSGKIETKTTEEFADCVSTPLGRSKWALPKVEPVVFNMTNLLIEPYVLGLLLGDGSFRQGTAIWFSTADAELLDVFPWDVRYKDHYDYRLCKGTNPVSPYTLICELGLAGKLSCDKFVPDEFLFANKEDRLALLQGLMDTDGSVSKGTTEFSSSSQNLAESVQFIVQSLGGKATLCKRETTHKPQFRVTISIQICPFRLRRKSESWRPNNKYLPKRILRKVTKSNPEECQCIQIDSEDGLFLIEGCIPTHNTHIAAGVATRMMRASQIHKIVICRPVVGVGKDIGYLPGSMEDKVGPYLIPLFDEFSYYCENSLLKTWAAHGQLEIVPLSMMRGRTFNNSFVILDEAQNASMVELRMLLTRIGAHSKMVVSGDLQQSDLPNSQAGAFNAIVDTLVDLEGVSISQLIDEDIVRHHLIGPIESRLANLSIPGATKE